MTDRRPEAIRKEILAQRKWSAETEVNRKSAEITEKFLKIIPPGKFRDLNVLFYRALPGEFNLHDLALALIHAGARAYFPRVVSRADKEMEAAQIIHPETSAWTVGAYGIEEPASHLPATTPEKLDVIFTPGAAFGKKGERIGMGGGYYDRYLARAPGALRIALCFDFQLHAALPQSEWDQPMHWILSESSEVRSPDAHDRLQDWITK